MFKLKSWESFCTYKTFGCFINGFVTFFDISNSTVHSDMGRFILMYQCADYDGKLVTKMSLISIYSNTKHHEKRLEHGHNQNTTVFCGEQVFEITQLNFSYPLPFKILASQFIHVDYREDEVFEGDLYIIFLNPNSFSNEMVIFNLTVLPQENSFVMTSINIFNA